MDPFVCNGCHSGPWAGFDHFCETLGVKENELPYAFAAYLARSTTWNGDYSPKETKHVD